MHRTNWAACQNWRVSINEEDEENVDNEYRYWLGMITQLHACLVERLDVRSPLSPLLFTPTLLTKGTIRRVCHPLRSFRNFRAARYSLPLYLLKLFPMRINIREFSGRVTRWVFRGRSAPSDSLHRGQLVAAYGEGGSSRGFRQMSLCPRERQFHNNLMAERQLSQLVNFVKHHFSKGKDLQEIRMLLQMKWLYLTDSFEFSWLKHLTEN